MDKKIKMLVIPSDRTSVGFEFLNEKVYNNENNIIKIH